MQQCALGAPHQKPVKRHGLPLNVAAVVLQLVLNSLAKEGQGLLQRNIGRGRGRHPLALHLQQVAPQREIFVRTYILP